MTPAEIAERWAKVTPGPWRWWTSNSFRRLSSDATGHDGDVLCGVVQSSDGHPDVRVSEADATAIARAPQDVAALLGEVARLDADLTEYRSEHHRATEEASGLRAEVEKMKPAYRAVENLRALNVACEAMDDQRIRDNSIWNQLTYEQADTYAKRNAADDALSQMTETPGERAARLRQDAREDASLSTTATRGGG